MERILFYFFFSCFPVLLRSRGALLSSSASVLPLIPIDSLVLEKRERDLELAIAECESAKKPSPDHKRPFYGFSRIFLAHFVRQLYGTLESPMKFMSDSRRVGQHSADFNRRVPRDVSIPVSVQFQFKKIKNRGLIDAIISVVFSFADIRLLTKSLFFFYVKKPPACSQRRVSREIPFANRGCRPRKTIF